MGLSPEQIAGRMELEDAEHSVCAEFIYRRIFIPTGRREGLCVIMVIGGMLALYAPFAASLVVEAIVGVAFLVGGILSLVQAFATRDSWSARGVYLVLGFFNVAVGVLLLMNPLEGLLALTLILAIGILVGGLFRAATGFQAQPETGCGWVAASGVLSVLVAIYIFSQYPEISAILLGVFSGVSLLADAAGYFRFAYSLKTGEDISDGPHSADA